MDEGRRGPPIDRRADEPDGPGAWGIDRSDLRVALTRGALVAALAPAAAAAWWGYGVPSVLRLAEVRELAVQLLAIALAGCLGGVLGLRWSTRGAGRALAATGGRLRRGVRAAASLAAGAVVGLFAGHLLVSGIERWRLSQEIARLERAGLPTTLEAAYGAPTPEPGEDAYPLYLALHERLDGTNFNEALESAGAPRFESDDEAAPAPLDAAAIWERLAAHRDASESLRAAWSRPRLRFPADVELATATCVTRHASLGGLLELEVLHAVARDEPDAALELLRLALERTAIAEGTYAVLFRVIAEWTVLGIFEALLSRGEPSAEALRALDAQLHAPPLDEALLSEVTTTAADRAAAYNPTRARASLVPSAWTSLYWVQGRDRRLSLGLAAEFRSLAALPPARWQGEIDALLRRAGSLAVAPLGAFTVGDLAWTTGLLLHVEDLRVLARAAIALRIHRLEHGAYPEGLDALVPGALDRLPRARTTDAPVRYRRRAAGFLLATEEGWTGVRWAVKR